MILEFLLEEEEVREHNDAAAPMAKNDELLIPSTKHTFYWFVKTFAFQCLTVRFLELFHHMMRPMIPMEQTEMLYKSSLKS